jgi:hypothetical protein
MAKLADALDLGSSGEIHGGSSPSIRTTLLKSLLEEYHQNLLKHSLKVFLKKVAQKRIVKNYSFDVKTYCQIFLINISNL